MDKANKGRLFWGAVIRVMMAAAATTIATTVAQRLLFGKTSIAVTMAVVIAAALGVSGRSQMSHKRDA